jgi:hypothetical protein
MRIYDIAQRDYDNKYNVWLHINHVLPSYKTSGIHTSYINVGVGDSFQEAVAIKNNYFNSHKGDYLL